MNRRRLALLIGGIVMLIAVVLLVVACGNKKPTPTPTGTPKEASLTRKTSSEKFGPRPRPIAVANVDIGVRIVPTPSPTPSPQQKQTPKQGRSQSTETLLAEASPLPSARSFVSPQPVATVTAAPLPDPPKFQPLPQTPLSGFKELVVFYVKGDAGKRQIYARSLDRDRDEPLFNDVYDNFAISFNGATQRLAYYSNEEGASDATKSRTKLKVYDFATGNSITIASGLPGVAPAAWSPDGKVLAIPTANSIFLANVSSGTSLQIPTANNPSSLIWSPAGFRLYFQAESNNSSDIYQADGITAEAKPLTQGAAKETSPVLSADGSKISFLREDQNSDGAVVVVRDVTTSQETTVTNSKPAASFIWNLTLNDLIFVRGANDGELSRLKNDAVNPIGKFENPVVIGWDRDYQHVFILADGDQGRAIYSVAIDSGVGEVVKAGIADAPAFPAR